MSICEWSTRWRGIATVREYGRSGLSDTEITKIIMRNMADNEGKNCEVLDFMGAVLRFESMVFAPGRARAALRCCNMRTSEGVIEGMKRLSVGGAGEERSRNIRCKCDATH